MQHDGTTETAEPGPTSSTLTVGSGDRERVSTMEAQLARLERSLTEERERAEEYRELSRRKDAFLALLGHELRNPLAAIEASLDLLAAPLVGVAAAEAPVRIIRSQLRHTVRLVDDLLDSSRALQGKLQLRKSQVPLESLVAQSVASVRSRIDGRNQWLALDLPEEEVGLEVDEARLVQVISNLLDNASKYTPDDGKLGIAATVEGDACVLRVWDQGIGIPKDLQSNVFEMFVQGERMQSRAPGGLGIGLALARRLVELHGGTLEIFSPVRGRRTGTEAVIRLPCLATVMRERTAPHPVVTTRPRRILMIEDNLELASMLSELLKAQGHDARVAQDGDGALALVQEFLPELVLIDIGLPGKNGYDVARELRARLGDGPKLVATSGYPPDHQRIGLFDEYLLKPVYPHQLASLLD